MPNDRIGRSFVEQLRIAADDPVTPVNTMRQGMRDAADVLETNNILIEGQRHALHELHAALVRLNRWFFMLGVGFFVVFFVNAVLWGSR